MAGNLLLTLGDDHFKAITNLSFPVMKRYAGRIGADFEVIANREYPSVNICYEKFQARRYLERYSRIAYIDGDVFIRSTAENIFEAAPYGQFSAVDETQCLNLWTQEKLLEQNAPYGWTEPWEGWHFNAGVMVFDETHRRLFDSPIITDLPWWDQPCLNVAVRRLSIPFFSLPVEFNVMPHHPWWKLKDLSHSAHLLHFAGCSFEKKLFAMRECCRPQG